MRPKVHGTNDPKIKSERAKAKQELLRDPVECAACDHPQGWHWRNTGACIECACLEFETQTCDDTDKGDKND